MITRLLPLLFCLALPVAAAPPGLRQPDAVRLANFDAHLGRALRQALAGGTDDALAVLSDAMAGADQGLSPEGDWNCRTLKLGGLLPIVAYGNFRCRIEAVGPDRWVLTKLTGSQRTVGTLTREARYGGLLYLGVGHVGREPAVGYEDLPPDDQSPVEPNQTHADVGLLDVMSPDRARLMLPAPILESHFDILYLTR